jgi:hypothetical protein
LATESRFNEAKQCGKENNTIVVVDPELFILDQDLAFQIIPDQQEFPSKNIGSHPHYARSHPDYI